MTQLDIYLMRARQENLRLINRAYRATFGNGTKACEEEVCAKVMAAYVAFLYSGRFPSWVNLFVHKEDTNGGQLL